MVIRESEVIYSSKGCCFLGYIEREGSHNGGVAFNDGGIYTVYITVIEDVSSAVGAFLTNIAAGDEHLSCRETPERDEYEKKPVLHYFPIEILQLDKRTKHTHQKYSPSASKTQIFQSLF